MFSKIRYSIGDKNLNKKARLVKRTRQVHNFKTCRNAAIIYDATRAEDFKPVKEFIKYLDRISIRTFLIGYVNNDQIHSNLLLWENCHFFCRKQLNIFYKPKTPDASDFLSKKFDILFDLSLTDQYPIKYLSTLSNADFKVGCYKEGEHLPDFMIDVRQKPELEYLIEQIKIYVGRLNNPDAET